MQDDCLRKTRTGKDHENCEQCGSDECVQSRFPDTHDRYPGQYRGCVSRQPTLSYRDYTYEATFCLNTALSVYARWDKLCYTPWNFPWIYGKQYYTATEVTLGAPVRKCGCQINGRCFAHLERNPDNTCDICDVVKDPYGWSLNPIICNDFTSCTYDDMCIRSKTERHNVSFTPNVCRGKPYVCPRPVNTTIQTLLMTCLEYTECDGRGGCFDVPKPRGTLCYNITDIDVCMPLSFCDGESRRAPGAHALLCRFHDQP